MFREMRRKKQLLPQERAVEIMEKATAGVLAVLGDEDYTYAVPLSYVYNDGKIYFHSATSGHKIDAVENSHKVSFCVIDKDEIVSEKYTTYFRSVIAFGKLHVVEDPKEKRESIKLLGMKYSAAHEAGMDKEIDGELDRLTMLRLDVEHMTGKEAIELVKQRL